MLAVASHLLTTLQGLLVERRPEVLTPDRLEHIRQAMLDSLGGMGGFVTSPIERRVLFAPDAESLWYQRPELLSAISRVSGERVAQEKMEQISALFEGLLPSGLTYRRVDPQRPSRGTGV